MQIEFKKEQIVKDKPQSILMGLSRNLCNLVSLQLKFIQKTQFLGKSHSFDYAEYKLSLPKWMIKNNSFIVDNSYTYWVFNLENIKRELSGNELIKLLEPYIKDQKITVNKPTAPKEYYLNDIKLKPLTFYE